MSEHIAAHLLRCSSMQTHCWDLLTLCMQSYEWIMQQTSELHRICEKGFLCHYIEASDVHARLSTLPLTYCIAHPCRHIAGTLEASDVHACLSTLPLTYCAAHPRRHIAETLLTLCSHMSGSCSRPVSCTESVKRVFCATTLILSVASTSAAVICKADQVCVQN